MRFHIFAKLHVDLGPTRTTPQDCRAVGPSRGIPLLFLASRVCQWSIGRAGHDCTLFIANDGSARAAVQMVLQPSKHPPLRKSLGAREGPWPRHV
jgi:hypothetical protein